MSAETMNIPEPMTELHAAWQRSVRPVLEPITGPLADVAPSADGRRRRTDDFRWLHNEMTTVARSEEGAQW